MALAEHLEKLRYFQRLVNFNSIREASMSIGISQAGLSKNISSLEDVLETKLFERTREGLILTPEGREVLRATERILAESANLETKIRSLKAPSSPAKLRIGMYDSIAVYFFTELKEQLAQHYPSVELELTADTSGSLAKAIRDDRIDFCIGVNLEPQATKRSKYVNLFEDHYAFYRSTRHEVDEAKLPLLIHAVADDGKGVNVETHLSQLIKQRGAHRIYNFETLKTLASQGHGIGVLPTQVAKPLVKTGVLKSIELPKAKRLFGQHSIGVLISTALANSFPDFTDELVRLGDRWSKT